MGKRPKLEPQATVGELKNKPIVEKKPIEAKPVLNKKSNTSDLKTSTQAGLQDGFTRTTIVINEDNLEKLRTLAFISKENVSYYISNAVDDFIVNYEKINGTIPILR